MEERYSCEKPEFSTSLTANTVRQREQPERQVREVAECLLNTRAVPAMGPKGAASLSQFMITPCSCGEDTRGIMSHNFSLRKNLHALARYVASGETPGESTPPRATAPPQSPGPFPPLVL